MSDVSIERMFSDGWERVRNLRLAALAEAPDSFGTTLSEDEARPPEFWRSRLERAEEETFLAVVDGRDAGLARGGFFEDGDATGEAGLFSLWVAPFARGGGAGDALVDAVIEWARAGGHRRLLLGVGDHNSHAIDLYERKGFVTTGNTDSLPPPREHLQEHERALDLGSARS